jgi:hypothetical protein
MLPPRNIPHDLHSLHPLKSAFSRDILKKMSSLSSGARKLRLWNALCHTPPQGEHMTEQEFQTKLAELMGEISTLPAAEREKLHRLADETRQRHERLRATVSNLQESLDYLRLSIKYLVFDLEATRRENSYLRKILDQSGSAE